MRKLLFIIMTTVLLACNKDDDNATPEPKSAELVVTFQSMSPNGGTYWINYNNEWVENQALPSNPYVLKRTVKSGGKVLASVEAEGGYNAKLTITFDGETVFDELGNPTAAANITLPVIQ